MTVLETIIFVVAVVLLAVSALMTMSWLTAFIREKEKALVYSAEMLICAGIVTILSFAVFIIGKGHDTALGLIALAVLISIPSVCGVILTPKGVCRSLSFGRKYAPSSEVSYEFKGSALEIYTPGSTRPAKFQIGTKSIRTVKMLADWYQKHGYENPLIKD